MMQKFVEFDPAYWIYLLCELGGSCEDLGCVCLLCLENARIHTAVGVNALLLIG